MRNVQKLNKEYLILKLKKKLKKKIIRYKTDNNFRSIKNTRNRIQQALRGKVKSSSTKEILGTDIETYRKWIKCQLTPEMNWSNIEMDHVKPICMFDLSRDEILKMLTVRKTHNHFSNMIINKKGINLIF